MQTINFYIGTNDKETLKRELDDAQVMAVIDACFENYTVAKVMGVYTMGSCSDEATPSERIVEDTFKVTLLCLNSWSQEKIDNVCKFLKNMLNQECIGVEIINNSSIQFV